MLFYNFIEVCEYSLFVHAFVVMLFGNETFSLESLFLRACLGYGNIKNNFWDRHHIFNFRKEGKRFKVAFVVPSVPLVEQQKNQLEKYLGHFAIVGKIYGGMNVDAVDFEALVKSVDILVLTPQILVNQVDVDYCRLDGKNPLQLDIFSLIILDEVHHTVKDHPYANLMLEYHRQKYDDSNISIKPMPQVVGLTASIGCPKRPKSSAQIVEHMIETCANFDAKSITRVKNNIAELAEFTSKTDDDIQIIVNSDEEAKKYHTYINSLSKSIENYFENLNGISSIPNIFKNLCDINEIEYPQWLSYANCRTAEAHLPEQSQMDAYSCLEYLRTLYDALLCSQCLPTKDTSEFYFADLGNPYGTKLEQYVYQKKQELGDFPSSKCDLYQKLIEKIKDQFKELPESRIIIFLPQRAYCQIASKIVERDAGIKGQYIASANAPREYGGCNPTQQQEALLKFKSGDIPILFATSVADEGLDIQKCNLVIKYQYATDSIAHVQRKGRARDLQSKSILFTCEDRLKKQETKIISNVLMINEAYQILDNMATSQKDLMFQTAIRKFNKERIQEEQDIQNMKNEMCPKAQFYNVLCKKCSATCLDCSNLRKCYMNCVIYGAEFWKTVNFIEEPLVQDVKRKRAGILGNIACKNCGFKFGTVINVKGTSLPMFSIDSIVFMDKRTREKILKKKWNKVYKYLFYPTDISYDEFIEMRTTELQPILRNRSLNDVTDVTTEMGNSDG